MSNKPFICFCVDGKSDISALREPFEDLFYDVHPDINVEFRQACYRDAFGGDLTSDINSEPDKIEYQIYDHYFRKQDKSSGLGWNDVTHIIHIIDLDGMYVPDNKVDLFTDDEREFVDSISDRTNHNILYYDDHIAARTMINNVTSRNERKRKIVERLLTCDTITARRRSVRYSLYYFSVNIDHFLYGDANLSGPDKMRKAANFADTYGSGDRFAEYLKNSPFSTQLDYRASWNAVKKRNNSLLRGTNVNLLVNEIRESSIEDWM